MPTLAESVAVITATAVDDLSVVWKLPSQAVLEALFELLPGIIDTWAMAAGSFTADWYDNRREQAKIKKAFFAIVPDLGDTGATQLAMWGAAPLTQLNKPPDFDLARSRVEGGLQRRITNHSRQTVITSSLKDPEALGWQRVSRPDGCGFCRMLAGRGAIYSEKGAAFGAHDYCHCYATPAWGGQPVPVRPFKPTGRNITDADRARTREWIKANT